MTFTLFLMFILSIPSVVGAGEGQIPYRIIATYPHDPDAFTQGLVYDAGQFYEGTGLYGRSTLRVVEPKTGVVKRMVNLPDHWFGEGVAVVGRHVLQLTWRSHIGIVYDKDTLHRERTFSYMHEGWGIAYDGKRLYVSDGTEEIRIWHPYNYREMGRFPVRDHSGPVKGLNELEFVNGALYANVWPTNRVVKINPITGRVLGSLDLTPLLSAEERVRADVTNGIAYDPVTKRVFVTGKLWPYVYVLIMR